MMGRFPGAAVARPGLGLLPMIMFGLWSLLALGGFVFLLVLAYRMVASLKRIEEILNRRLQPPTDVQKPAE